MFNFIKTKTEEETWDGTGVEICQAQAVCVEDLKSTIEQVIKATEEGDRIIPTSLLDKLIQNAQRLKTFYDYKFYTK